MSVPPFSGPVLDALDAGVAVPDGGAAEVPEVTEAPTLDGPSEPAAAPEPPAPAPADLGGRATAVLAAVERLDQRLAAETERAAARERVIDRQHEQIERLRSERRANHLRPVVTDLYRLRNDLLRQAATVPAEMSKADVVALLVSFADTVAEALERCGVTVLPDEIGMSFVAGRHQVAAVVETDDPALEATVAGIVQDGYLDSDGTVVAPARIRLYRYAQKETTDE